MSFFEDLVKESNALENSKEEVIEEIVSSYKEYVRNGGIENYLKEFIRDHEMRERSFFDCVSFWAYHSGCSTTNFSAFGWQWTNPYAEKYSYESHTYKGLDLPKNHKGIVEVLKCMTIDELHRLGFIDIDCTEEHSNLGYKKYSIIIRW